MKNTRSGFCFLIIFFGLVFCAQGGLAQQVYKCTVNGVTTFQGMPCKDKKTQKVACVNYARGADFKKASDDKCTDNGANNGGYGGSSLNSYSGSSSSSSYASSTTRNQYVSGYTRKDGTRVQSYMRSKK